MTRDRLRTLLGGLAGRSHWPEEDPASLVRELEAAADARPRDRALADAVHAAHGYASAGDGLPQDVGGVRRERLVRWDDWSCTWDGIELRSGRPARARVLRATAARDPVLRRALLRDGRALQGIVVGLEAVDGRWPALVAVHPGPPLSPAADPGEREDPSVLVRLLGTGLAALSRWERASACPAELAEDEIHDAPDGLHVLCLTPSDDADVGARVGGLAALLLRWWDGGVETPVDDLLEGLSAFPPRSVSEASEAWHGALAEDLARTWHHLRRRHALASNVERRARFLHIMRRLAATVPAPTGRGAVGVDLEGRTLVVEGGDQGIAWGPATGALQPVWGRDGGVDPRQARRLLRASAAAPPNRRLSAEVGGSDAFTEAACRWLTAALQLRTTILLLERSG